MQYILPVLKWLLPYVLKLADKHIPEILEDLFVKIKNNKKKDDVKMSETTVQTTVASSVSDAVDNATSSIASAVEEATTTAITTATETVTSTAETVCSTTATLTTGAVNDLSAKIAELAAEIKTTGSIWVKIRNTAEIGILSALLVKAGQEVADKIK